MKPPLFVRDKRSTACNQGAHDHCLNYAQCGCHCHTVFCEHNTETDDDA